LAIHASPALRSIGAPSPLIRFKPRKNWLPRSPAIAFFSVS
jgi:hypothetical protein